ncbi:MAG: thioredoxin family protein [Thermoplasmata archaeon]|nr:thioredoxin family protein [Thermoplasmata archaeon]
MMILMNLLGCSSGDKDMPALKEAKERALENNQPLLLEFTSNNCTDCARAIALAASDAVVRASLDKVSFLGIDVKSEDGKRLAEKYLVGVRLPTYVLVDSDGKEIARWASFISPEAFVTRMKRATSDLTTVEARLERMKNTPSVDDAAYLAGHYTSIREYAKAAEYFHKADFLNNGKRRDNFKFQVFDATANAAWYGQAAIADVEKAADDVLNSDVQSKLVPARVATGFSNAARRTGNTDRIARFMRIALDKIGEPDDDNIAGIQASLRAELQLYGDHDTASAIETKKSAYGPAYRRTPVDEFDFAYWCADQGINLDEAEATMKRFLESRLPPGRSAGGLYQALSKIALVRADHAGALTYARKAVESDPQNPLLTDYLNELPKAP